MGQPESGLGKAMRKPEGEPIATTKTRVFCAKSQDSRSVAKNTNPLSILIRRNAGGWGMDRAGKPIGEPIRGGENRDIGAEMGVIATIAKNTNPLNCDIASSARRLWGRWGAENR